ncbi:MAG: hypothetical protein A2V67_05705 [Deltaproteobacteria bacterium RBG_13_61_14]|nr:MAG: hypothetical protein A2V67_05705 [Deltaproteobacteria bacterium RBG_13_61_14]
MTREELLHRIKELLQEAYGDRLQGVIFYGSEARGEATKDSDIDILVLLKGPVDLWEDIRTNVKALYDLELEDIHPIHALPVEIEVFEAGEYAIFRNVKIEGTRL